MDNNATLGRRLEYESARGFIVEMMRFKSIIDLVVKRARSDDHLGTSQRRARAAVSLSHIAGPRHPPTECFDDRRSRRLQATFHFRQLMPPESVQSCAINRY